MTCYATRENEVAKFNKKNVENAPDKIKAGAEEMIKAPMWLIEQILLKHEKAVLEVMKELHDEKAKLEARIVQLEQTQPLTEEQIIGCIVRAGCLGTVKMTYETGPYDIDRTSTNADRLVKEIERAHGIGVVPNAEFSGAGTASAGTNC